MSKSERNPALDLLRCAAIVWVVACHLTPPNAPAWIAVWKLGGKGVDLFFVLSGWLLGEQLFRELRDTGRIDVRRFWLRRWLRTLPAYYAVLVVCTYGWQLLASNKPRLDWSYLFFGQTYLSSMPYFGVSWSLCVEEHFYLAVAPLILLCSRSRLACWSLPALLLLPSLCRLMGWYHDLAQTHVRYDQCALGVLLAAAKVFWPIGWQRLTAWAPLLASVAGCAVGSIILSRLTSAWQLPDPGPLTWGLIFAAFVLFANARSSWPRAFYFPPIRYLALRAYSIYLLHPEVLALLKRINGCPLWLKWVLTWSLTLILAEMLYRIIERPLMQARDYFRASRGWEKARNEPSQPHPPGESGNTRSAPIIMPAPLLAEKS